MDVDTAAPILIRCARDLDRPPAVVWKVLTAIEDWPRWVPSIDAARMEGALLPGARFRWRVNGMPIHSILRDVERPSRLCWTGSSFGMHVVHRWEIEALGAGSRVLSLESVSGWWVRPLQSRLAPMMRRSVEEWMDALVRRVRQELDCG